MTNSDEYLYCRADWLREQEKRRERQFDSFGYHHIS